MFRSVFQIGSNEKQIQFIKIIIEIDNEPFLHAISFNDDRLAEVVDFIKINLPRSSLHVETCVFILFILFKKKSCLYFCHNYTIRTV